METPRGYNPVGESAPGLPRHDAPIPGHVPGPYIPIDVGYDSMGGDFNAPTGGGNRFSAAGLNTSYTGPGLGEGFGKWSCRVFMVFITYLTLPLQLALYPFAGMPALAVGYFVFHSSIMSGAGYDRSMGSAWMFAWLVLLPAMRIETGIETKAPGYRNVRHLFRVLILSGCFYYYVLHYRADGTPQLAALEALIVAAPIHFVLRSRLASGLWDSMQTISWMRKA